MTLEQPGLGSDPPNGSGRERGATPYLYDMIYALTDYVNLILQQVYLRSGSKLRNPGGAQSTILQKERGRSVPMTINPEINTVLYD